MSRASRTIPLDLNGLTDLPAGKIATVVTFFEISTDEPSGPRPDRADLSVRRVPQPEIAWYRNLFRRIGEDWLWFSRAVISDAQLGRILRDPATEVHVLEKEGVALGMAELDRSVPGEAKIAFFGLVPEAIGTGAAQVLMWETLERARHTGAGRVWLHTCTIDHPAAIRFYLRQGFRAFKVAVEVADDPRLKGLLPLDAAKHLPVIAQ